MGRKGEKCFKRSKGPRVLVRKVRSASSAFILVMDFSGKRRPGRMKVRWRWWGLFLVEGKRFLHVVAAFSIDVSSMWPN